MGTVVFWGLIRVAVLIPVLWILNGYIETKFWWTILVMAVYGVVIFPATVQYRKWREENSEVIDDTLCSTCKHFEESAVLCMIHDEHPKRDYIPCEGMDWEPK